jgi:molybdopterin-containing oxidoreductase family membrane subunit
MFLLVCELFTAFYTDSAHMASTRYLFLGLHGHNALVPRIWTTIGLNTAAMVILYSPLYRKLFVPNVACVLILYGISIEKGMGLIVPPFIPSPLGEMVEYRRSDARQSADLRRRHARQSDLQELASQHVGHVQN